MTARPVSAADRVSHPAVAAWRELEPDRPEPEGVVMLKGKAGTQQTKKSAVYRLSCTGPGGYEVIAKRCRSHTAATERLIYTEVLPQLPVPILRFHGLVKEAEADFCWMFLDDAGDSEYSLESNRHRQLAGEWLALVHGCSGRVELPELPDRSPDHYIKGLRASRDTILRNIDQPVLTADDRRAFERLLMQCDAVEARWDRITDFCAAMPPSVVHGDFVPKNMRVRSGASGPALLVYDWECAGWGVPAADLTQRDTRSPSPDLDAYCRAIRQFWPQLHSGHVEMLATVGRIFRLVGAVGWACDSLGFDPSRSGLGRPLSLFATYEECLRGAYGELDRGDMRLPPALARYPDDPSLAAGLSAALKSQGFAQGPVELLDRNPNASESSSPSELVTCRHNGDGTPCQLFCKYGTGYRCCSYGHRGGVAYEAEVYQNVLEPLGVTAPRFMGAYKDPSSGATWLALEHLTHCTGVSHGDPDSMPNAARWIGRFHAAAAGLATDPMPFLRTYDAAYYLGWIERTARFSAHLHREFKWLGALWGCREKMAECFLNIPRTIIHGEYYVKNILIQDGVIRPADWESTAVAFGEIDLAALVEGRWSREIVQECEREYQIARWGAPHPEFGRHLDAAQLYLRFRWLGDHPRAMDNEEGCRWSFEMMRDSAERLDLL